MLFNNFYREIVALDECPGHLLYLAPGLIIVLDDPAGSEGKIGWRFSRQEKKNSVMS